MQYIKEQRIKTQVGMLTLQITDTGEIVGALVDPPQADADDYFMQVESIFYPDAVTRIIRVDPPTLSLPHEVTEEP